MFTIGIALALISVAPSSPAPTEGGIDSVWVLIDASGAAEDRDHEKEILQRAETLARAALDGHEDDVPRLYALAAVLGLRANVEGGRTKIRVASELSTRLEEILALDPEHAGARHMLGRLHAAVRRMSRVTRWLATNLLGGDVLKTASWAEAEENLLFAEQHAPEVLDHHLQLALLYRDTDRPDLALAEITHVMDLQASSVRDMTVLEEAHGVWTALQE
jgi:hypothetical protein